ncbi:hypothetical protein ACJX0J_036586 [Zea mays]
MRKGQTISKHLHGNKKRKNCKKNCFIKKKFTLAVNFISIQMIKCVFDKLYTSRSVADSEKKKSKKRISFSSSLHSVKSLPSFCDFCQSVRKKILALKGCNMLHHIKNIKAKTGSNTEKEVKMHFRF